MTYEKTNINFLAYLFDDTVSMFGRKRKQRKLML